jgi:hypothetical protein
VQLTGDQEKRLPVNDKPRRRAMFFQMGDRFGIIRSFA